jgi:hypothetical protein
LQDELPDPAYLNNEVVKIGSSPTGVAVAWHPCCMQDAKPGHPLIVLRVLVLWGVNDYDICLPLAVGGYTPLGKTLPSVIQYPDLTEHSVHPLTSLINYEFCVSPVDQTTWGKVKALYR